MGVAILHSLLDSIRLDTPKDHSLMQPGAAVGDYQPTGQLGVSLSGSGKGSQGMREDPPLAGDCPQ